MRFNPKATAAAEAALLPKPTLGRIPFSSLIMSPVFNENSSRICLATTPAVFFSGSVGMVSAARPETLISMPFERGFIVTLSFGFSRAMPKTSKPGPRLAVVAGALTITLFGGDAPRFLPARRVILKPPY